MQKISMQEMSISCPVRPPDSLPHCATTSPCPFHVGPLTINMSSASGPEPAYAASTDNAHDLRSWVCKERAASRQYAARLFRNKGTDELYYRARVRSCIIEHFLLISSVVLVSFNPCQEVCTRDSVGTKFSLAQLVQKLVVSAQKCETVSLSSSET